MPSFARGTGDAFEAGAQNRATRIKLIESARIHGWLGALRNVIYPIRRTGPAICTEATDEAKGDLVFLLPIGPDCRVLDLGCGWGQVSLALAARGANCVAADTDPQNAEFAALRCHQSGFDHVYPVAVESGAALPFPDRSFDFVLIPSPHGLFGYATGSRATQHKSRLGALTEVRRILKPDGMVYLAARTRSPLWPGFDIGSRSEWENNCFGELDPQSGPTDAANSRREFQSSRPSVAGYARLFKSARFSVESAFAVLPDLNKPRRFASLFSDNSLDIARAFSDSFNRKGEALGARILPVILFRRLITCYAFILRPK